MSIWQLLTFAYCCPTDPSQVHQESVKQPVFGAPREAEFECASCKSRLRIYIESVEADKRGTRTSVLLALAAPISPFVAYYAGDLLLSALREPEVTESRTGIFGLGVVFSMLIFALLAFVGGVLALAYWVRSLWHPFVPIKGETQGHQIRGLNRAERRRLAG